MGYWHSTCGLSNLAIRGGDSVLMIIFKKEKSSRAIWSLSEIHRTFSVYQNSDKSKTRHAKSDKFKFPVEQDEAGNYYFEFRPFAATDEVFREWENSYYFPIDKLVIGKSDEHGGIENFKVFHNIFRDATYWQFHVPVIEAMLENAIQELIKKPFDLVDGVLDVLQETRRSPVDLRIIGKQDEDIEELHRMALLNRTVYQEIQKRIIQKEKATI